jgi:hypothetical protein
MRLSHRSITNTIVAGSVAAFTAAATTWLAVPAAAESEPTPIVVGTSSGLDPDKIVVEEQTRQAEYHFPLDLPTGASLRAETETTDGVEISGAVVLEDSSGMFIGAYDQPLALSADNTLLPSTYRIDGSTLVQTVDFTSADFPVVIDPIYSAPSPSNSIGVLRFVGVPPHYVYNTDLGLLHDYCSYSPDEFPSATGENANFRGTCARHDLCYGGGTVSKVVYDSRLNADMRDNCNHFYTSGWDPNLAACLATAQVYWAAVVTMP